MKTIEIDYDKIISIIANYYGVKSENVSLVEGLSIYGLSAEINVHNPNAYEFVLQKCIDNTTTKCLSYDFK